jgi:hypothetical protein
MSASLTYFREVCKNSPESYRYLTSSFTVILKQVIEHKLPRDYDYHRMPAPWIQTKIMEILAVLGKDDKETSESIYEVIQMALKRAEDLAINIGHALVYQCIKCILTLYPSDPLLEIVSKSISKFFANECNNLKYVGVTTLNAMLKVDLKYAEEHQENVVECLECPDDTLKLKTLDLLHTMTNKDNVEAIIEKMLEHLQFAPKNSGVRSDLVKKIYRSVEKFSPNKKWFVKTMNKLYEMGADLITQDISNKFINVICEHETESDDDKFRETTIKIYKKLLKKSYHIPDSHMKVLGYILGEFVPKTHDSESATDILNLLCKACDKNFEQMNTIGWIIAAITKIHIHLDFEKNKKVDEVIETFRHSAETHLQQRCKEYIEIRKAHENGRTSVKDSLFTSYTELKTTTFDFELNFLDDYVQDAVNQGANVFDEEKKAQAISLTGTHEIGEKELNFTPYDKPRRAIEISTQPRSEKRVDPKDAGGPKLIVKNSSKKGRWTKEGFKGPDAEKKPEPEKKTESEPTDVKETPVIKKDPNKPTIFKKHEDIEKNEKDKKKKKIGSALFAGVVKKNDSNDSDSDSDNSSSGDDSDEEKAKKKKKSKKNKKKKDEAVEEESKQNSNVDELFDLGDSHDIDPYDMLGKDTEGEVSMGKNASAVSPSGKVIQSKCLESLMDPSLVNIMSDYQNQSQQNTMGYTGGNQPAPQQQFMQQQQQNYGYNNQQFSGQQPGMPTNPNGQPQSQSPHNQPAAKHDDPFADIF